MQNVTKLLYSKEFFMSEIKLYVYNAGKGDCLLVKYLGKSDKYRNILIDSGTSRFKRCLSALERELSAAGEGIDLVVLTHVDNDHIGGLLGLERTNAPLTAGEFIISHPDGADMGFMAGDAQLSVRGNDELYKSLVRRNATVRSAVRGDILELDGARISIISPTQERLDRLFTTVLPDTPLGGGIDWAAELGTLMSAPLPLRDTSVNNLSSIMFVLEYADVRLLFTGDGVFDDIREGLQSLGFCETGNRGVRFDAVKLPHHGSARNLSEEWPKTIDSHRFVICADGAGHPDKQTIAKLLKWYGEIEIYSGTDWWSRDFLVREDTERFIASGKLTFSKAEGGELVWKSEAAI